MRRADRFFESFCVGMRVPLCLSQLFMPMCSYIPFSGITVIFLGRCSIGESTCYFRSSRCGIHQS